MNFHKAAGAKLDYGFNLVDWLDDGDTVVSCTWTVTAGLTSSSPSNSTTQVKIWISGGTVGSSYTATAHFITAAGREDERSHTFFIEAR
jgi:hypothetical protein